MHIVFLNIIYLVPEDQIKFVLYHILYNRIRSRVFCRIINMKPEKIPELLAPAGSMDTLKAAVSAGADAVYMGGKRFGARNLASNFTPDELREAVEYCHSRNVRVYVTHNILVHDNEIAASLNELKFLYSIGVDAVLLQDAGILSAASKLLPGLELHASTQMTIHNRWGVVWAMKNGVSRVVLSRELGPGDIADVRSLPGAEGIGLEVFVHGALCCSYSGQCLFSSMIGGRSGNRGLCAQPCRKEYDIFSFKLSESGDISEMKRLSNCYIMSPADLCTCRNLEEIACLGVDSLKIEGRMKSLSYVAIVVSVYRKTLDGIISGNSCLTDDDETDLMLAFNRSFTAGYISGEGGREIMAPERPGNRGVYAGKVARYDPVKRKIHVRADGRIVPEPGDGILIRQNGHGEDFGLTIPGNAEIRGLEISFHTPLPAAPGSSVYINKSQSLERKVRNIISVPGGVYRKIPVSINISLDGRTPVAVAEFSTLRGRSSIKARAGFVMEKAKSRPLDPGGLKNIFCKTGNLQFEVDNYESGYSGGLFAPVSMLNEFRREVFSSVEKEMIRVCLPQESGIMEAGNNIETFISVSKNKYRESCRKREKVLLSVYVSGIHCLMAALQAGCSRVYYETDSSSGTYEDDYCRELGEAISAAQDYGVEFVWKWPRITDQKFLKSAIAFLKEPGYERPDGILTENPGDGLFIIENCKEIPLFGGQGLNIFNHLSVDMFSEDYRSLTLSCELNGDEICELCRYSQDYERRPSLEYVVHGPAEILISETNLPGSALGEIYSPLENYGVADSTGRIFPMRIDDYGRTYLYNSAVTCLIDSIPKIIATGIDGISLDLRYGSQESVAAIVDAYKRALEISVSGDKGISRRLEGLKKEVSKFCREITAGHFYRGV